MFFKFFVANKKMAVLLHQCGRAVAALSVVGTNLLTTLLKIQLLAKKGGKNGG